MTLQNKAKKYPAITYLVYITFLTFERSEGSTMFVNEFIFLVISLLFLSTQPVHTARNIVAASKIVRDQLYKFLNVEYERMNISVIQTNHSRKQR